MNAYEKMKRDNEKYIMSQNSETVAEWNEEFGNLYEAISNIHENATTEDNPLPRFAETVRGCFTTFCPYQQYITIDALEKKDYPHGIADNSLFFQVEIDLADKTFCINKCGHVWLTLAEQKRTNLAMASMKNIVQANGGKWLRTTKYKDAKDFAKKLAKAWESAMEIISEQTGGYPYKQLTEDSNPIYEAKHKTA